MYVKIIAAVDLTWNDPLNFCPPQISSYYMKFDKLIKYFMLYIEIIQLYILVNVSLITKI